MKTPRPVALVTGASSGIGYQLARELCARGWGVAGIGRRVEPMQALAAELASQQREFAWARADVTDAAELARQIADLESRLGPVELLIASAGVAGDTPALSLDPAAVEQIIRVNLIGTSNTLAAVLPGMLARKRGHIVALSSLASFAGLPAQMAYCASKAGLNAMMESLWLDVRHHGIHVTTICPGYIDTPQATGMYRPEYLLPVQQATSAILRAIESRQRFCAFPRWTALQLKLLRLLPGWLQDWLLVRAIKKARVEVPAESASTRT